LGLLKRKVRLLAYNYFSGIQLRCQENSCGVSLVPLIGLQLEEGSGNYADLILRRLIAHVGLVLARVTCQQSSSVETKLGQRFCCQSVVSLGGQLSGCLRVKNRCFARYALHHLQRILRTRRLGKLSVKGALPGLFRLPTEQRKLFHFKNTSKLSHSKKLKLCSSSPQRKSALLP